jgi:hypothetical protein
MRQSGFAVISLTQTIMPPGSIQLRGGALQKIGKKICQYPNVLVTKAAHVWGDRMEVIARR